MFSYGWSIGSVHETACLCTVLIECRRNSRGGLWRQSMVLSRHASELIRQGLVLDVKCLLLRPEICRVQGLVHPARVCRALVLQRGPHEVDTFILHDLHFGELVDEEAGVRDAPPARSEPAPGSI